MGKPTGFIEFQRQTEAYRPVAERLLDYAEIFESGHDEQLLQTQGARCMDCGVPFCQSTDGCPISNLIPEWNHLIYTDQWQKALERLEKTNNFAEFTGRVCPAPCEGACVLGINEPAVAIKNIEQAIIDKGFEAGWVRPKVPKARTGMRVAVVGSGPAGLAAADQLNQAGHQVCVYEREDRIGGLLMYGIPNMKLEKQIVDRRLDLLRAAGISFFTNSDVGGSRADAIPMADLMRDNDAVLLATGATVARDLDAPGRSFQGIHLAMDYLTESTRCLLDSNLKNGAFVSAHKKNVVVIGGGDTGTDCIGTALRQGCESVVNFELLPEPPEARAPENPWPQWPLIRRVDYGHQEANEKFGDDPRSYALLTKKFLGDSQGQLTGIETVEVSWKKSSAGWQMTKVAGSEKIWPADLVFLAMGFTGPEHYVSDAAGIGYDRRSNYSAEYGEFRTSIAAVFAAGDCRRGQSLVVWGIDEGRRAAKAIDQFLTGNSLLP